ncbi:hypothetical protein HYU06_02250 [Candidatus Woesearchaeota archaeon]|nr:hypothetical protein [Candidatus Woesearchaeota archaeon]
MINNEINSIVSGTLAAILVATLSGCPSKSNPTPQPQPPTATVPVEKPFQQQPQTIPYSASVDYTAPGGVSVNGLQPIGYTGLVTLYGAPEQGSNGRYLNIGDFPLSALEAAVAKAAREGRLPENKPEEDRAAYRNRIFSLAAQGLIKQLQKGDPNAIVLSPSVIEEQGLGEDASQPGSSIYKLVIPEGGITNVSLQYRLIAPAVNDNDGKPSPQTGAAVEVYILRGTDVGNGRMVYSNSKPVASLTVTNPGGSDTPTPVPLPDLAEGLYKLVVARKDDPNHISNLLVQSLEVRGTQYVTPSASSAERPK